MSLADAIVAYVAEQTRLRGRGPMHQWSIHVTEIERVFDIEAGTAQTAIRKAWAEGWLHVDVCRGDDCAHSVMLGELR
jgi:hypothetical protein